MLDILDSALLRPGRIDRKIEFPPPGPEARVAILRIHSRKVRASLCLIEYLAEVISADVVAARDQSEGTGREDGSVFRC